MGSTENTFSELVTLLRSWVPWRSEPPSVSRDFWMPDQSCRVCYECDSQFTVINRRHHCRLCGRVFCARCTSNSIPVPSSDSRTNREECEKIRVCHYCFQQWQLGTCTFDNGILVPDLDLSSPSAESFVSTRSSGTANSSNFTLGSMPYSTGPYQRTDCSSIPTTNQISEVDTNSITQGDGAVETKDDYSADVEYNPQQSYAFSVIRSDDEDEEYGSFRSDSYARTPVNDYYHQVGLFDVSTDDRAENAPLDEEAVESKSLSSSPFAHSFGSPVVEGMSHVEQKDEPDMYDECEAPSSMYDREDDRMEPVDFENNCLLWVPPEPEDEEDEREGGLFDDDDDEGDAAGEWGLQASSSFGSGEFRNKDRSSEEHRKVMKNVVDGHFRALVAQLLQVENVPVGDENNEENWLEIITSLSWEAATLLKPDMSKGGGMDPGGYVKVKCIASGRRCESTVVKGVVCKKNVANRRMKSNIKKPRLLILGGALEYQRVTNHLSSFDTLLQQEMDHLKMAVAKIEAHRPDVLLVEKSVSRFAQEYLLEKGISLVLNIKRPLLERLTRCTGAQIIPSIDHLSSPNLGFCDMFHVDRFVEDLGTAGQDGKKSVKTLMYFEGCPKPLGFTILLRGANGDELKKVKHVVQYGVFAAYHLALETSFLADEGATLPELPLKSPINVALPDTPIRIERTITVPFSPNDRSPILQINSEPPRSSSVPAEFIVTKVRDDMVEKIELIPPTDGTAPQSKDPNLSAINSIASISTCPPIEKVLADSNHITEKRREMESAVTDEISNVRSSLAMIGEKLSPDGLKSAENVLEKYSSRKLDETAASHIQNSEVLAQKDLKNDYVEEEGFKEAPSDHQSILVSLSSRCVWKGTVCERSHLFRIKYYGNFDKPLGRFLRDHLFDQNYTCHSCEMPSEAHVHCYTHRQGTLTISVKKLPEMLLPGEKDGKIWMWHRCLKCPRTNGFPPATRRVVMSDAAWGLSFGKFLELSFSNHAAASRVASCGHSLHRDCLRFYGFGKMVACFRYATINVLSVYLPPSKLDFGFESQEWIQRETDEVVNRAELLFSEVLNALGRLALEKSGCGQHNGGSRLPDSRRQIAELEAILHREKNEFEESLQKIMKKQVNKGHLIIDILEINKLRRQLLFQSYLWDHRLVYAINPRKNTLLGDILIPISTDDDKPLTPSREEKSPTASEKLPEIVTSKSVQSSGGFDSPVNENLSKTVVKQAETEAISNQYGRSEGLDEKSLLAKDSCGLKEDEARAQPDKLEPSENVHEALSEGQVSAMKDLSDTLDAAWTGENQPVNGVLKDDARMPLESAVIDNLSSASQLKRLVSEEQVEDQNGNKSNQSLSFASFDKGPDMMEDSSSWLKMPFLNIYRSLNKNFLANSDKLDKLAEYSPVYVSSFRELELQSGARMLLPVGLNDTVIPVYDDEPTSIIAYALLSQDYQAQLSDEMDRMKDIGDLTSSFSLTDSFTSQSFPSLDDPSVESFRSPGSVDESLLSMSSSRSSVILDPLSYTKALHARISFGDDGPHGKVKYTVVCYYAKRFDSLRRICCPSELDFIRSLSRCKKWGAQGGKSNVFFAKTLDDRFIIKQVTKTELESFIKFAPAYFKYLSDSIGSRSPTCLAKILGIYQVTSKHLKGGRESKMDVLVMENLLFERKVTRLYDLKGSSRSRYNPDSSGSNKVLLDQNLIEAMPTSPIFLGNKAKRVLERAVWNDTSFLASIDVMDYSLLVGIDEEKHELVLGIIDFMRQYTWDKHLETWVKASGILGGPRHASPTVISPKQYKKRFRKAMSTYFLVIPDQWSPSPSLVPSRSLSDMNEENSQGGTSVE